MRWLAVMFLCWSWSAVSFTQASDFWEEVKTPGLREWHNLVYTARLALREERWAVAESTASQAIEALPDRAPAYVVRGRARGQSGRVREAADDFQRALVLDVAALDDPADGEEAAESLMSAGEYGSARQVLARTLAQMPNTTRRRRLYILYGDVLQVLGQIEEAILAYREVLRMGHDASRAVAGLALALRRRGEVPEAEAVARDGALALVYIGDEFRAGGALPVDELKAREGVLALARGDRQVAESSFEAVSTDSPWYEHAQAELTRLRQPATRRTIQRRRAR